MKNLNTQLILSEAIRLIARHAPAGEISDTVLEGLADLQRTLEPRKQVTPPSPPPHLATNPNEGVEKAVEEWLRKNGNPRLSPELRQIADTLEGVDL